MWLSNGWSLDHRCDPHAFLHYDLQGPLSPTANRAQLAARAQLTIADGVVTAGLKNWWSTSFWFHHKFLLNLTMSNRTRTVGCVVGISAVAAFGLAACGGGEVTLHGTVSLTDSDSGWGTLDGPSEGATCQTSAEQLSGWGGFPQPFPPTGEVVVKDSSGHELGSATLDHPKKGTVKERSDGSYVCNFSWHLKVPSADTYAVTFPNATEQHVSAADKPVTLAIGNGVGFRPGEGVQ